MTRGFSIFETIIVLAALSIVASTGIVIGIQSYEKALMRSDADTIVSALMRARSQSMNDICFGTSCTYGKPHGVYVTRQKAMIFQGTDYPDRDAAYDQELALSGNSLFAGSDEFVFQAIYGTLPSPLALKIISSSTSASNKTIVVDQSGNITVSPS